MDVAHAFIVELVNAITTFHARATSSLFGAHKIACERIQMKLRNRYCAAPGDVRIPLSISSTYLKARESKKSPKRRKSKQRVRGPNQPKA